MGVKLWEAQNLSPRVQRLRDEYWSFYERDYYRNEVHRVAQVTGGTALCPLQLGCSAGDLSVFPDKQGDSEGHGRKSASSRRLL